jgi:hypothetical protein
MKKSLFIKWLVLGTLFILSTACSLTPHANIGLNLDYYGGEFHVRPSAQVGVYGRP